LWVGVRDPALFPCVASHEKPYVLKTSKSITIIYLLWLRSMWILKQFNWLAEVHKPIMKCSLPVL